MDKKRRLAYLLGTYIDEESDIFTLINDSYDKGLKFNMPVKQFDLFEGLGTSLIEFIHHNFFLVDKGSRLRGHLGRPFLFVDEVYEIKLGKGKTSLKIILDFPEMKKSGEESGVQLKPANYNLLSGLIKTKILNIEIRRIKKGHIVKDITSSEFLDNSFEYATFLKEKIIQSLLSIKSPDLLSERLILWGVEDKDSANLKSLIANDFGIKDLVHLFKIYTHFKFDLDNDRLIELDIEQIKYQKKLQEFLGALNSGTIYLSLT